MFFFVRAFYFPESHYRNEEMNKIMDSAHTMTYVVILLKIEKSVLLSINAGGWMSVELPIVCI